MTVNVLKGIPGIGAMIVDAATAEKTCARHGKNVLKNIKPNAPKPRKVVEAAAVLKVVEAAAVLKVVEAAAVLKVVEAAAVLKAASLPHANKPKKHGPSALKNIKPNAPKPPKAVAAAAAHKAASLPHANKLKKHGPRALRNIKPNAPKPPKAVATVAAHSNGAPRVMTFAKPLPSASSNLPNPAKK